MKCISGPLALAVLAGCSHAVSPQFDAHRALFSDTLCVREAHAEKLSIAWVEFSAEGACIHYDPMALRSVSARYGYSAAVGVFAHEYGHVLCVANRRDESQECADAWAGCALAREGYEPMRYAELLRDNDPGSFDSRYAATWRGWNRCRGGAQ